MCIVQLILRHVPNTHTRRDTLLRLANLCDPLCGEENSDPLQHAQRV